MSNDAQQYNIATIRQLLLAAFTPEELRRFCHDRPDFRPIFNRFGSKYNLEDMVNEVITYCDTRLFFPELLTEVKQTNPRQYARFERELHPNEVPAPPDDPQVYFDRGNTRSAQGNLAGAIEEYNRAIALDPDLASVYYNRGIAHIAQGNMAEAIEDYDRAIALFPDGAERSAAYTNRGAARQAQGDLAGAIEDYSRAIALDPDNADGHNNRGAARLAQRDLAGAIEDCSRSIALNPKDVSAYINRGEAHLAQGNLVDAVEDFGNAVSIASQVGDSRNEGYAWWGLARACKKENTEYAPASCQEAIQILESIKDPNLEQLYALRRELLESDLTPTGRLWPWSTPRRKKKKRPRR